MPKPPQYSTLPTRVTSQVPRTAISRTFLLLQSGHQMSPISISQTPPTAHLPIPTFRSHSPSSSSNKTIDTTPYIPLAAAPQHPTPQSCPTSAPMPVPQAPTFPFPHRKIPRSGKQKHRSCSRHWRGIGRG